MDIPLDKALQTGNINRVKELLEDSNQIVFDEATPLLIACNSGHLDLAKYLISIGANVNYFYMNDNSEISSLHLAINQNNFELVKLLINSGAYKDGNLAGMVDALSISD